MSCFTFFSFLIIKFHSRFLFPFFISFYFSYLNQEVLKKKLKLVFFLFLYKALQLYYKVIKKSPHSSSCCDSTCMMIKKYIFSTLLRCAIKRNFMMMKMQMGFFFIRESAHTRWSIERFCDNFLFVIEVDFESVKLQLPKFNQMEVECTYRW